VGPKCAQCGKQLRKFRWRDHADINNGGKRKWGDYGDNVFCGLRCGYWFALARFRDHGRKQ